jgi:hypothetical protein
MLIGADPAYARMLGSAAGELSGTAPAEVLPADELGLRRRSAVALLAALALAAAGCGSGDPAPDPAAAVRAAATTYVQALLDGRWADACARMTPAARAAVAADGRSCARALRAAALPRAELATAKRLIPGAPVRIEGERATLGPVGDLPRPLRFARGPGGGWLAAA